MDESIDLRQFRYFLALSEELHFGRAALRLHISQPPLSRQIRQLEDQLGVDLFARSKSGVTLTRAGAAFLPEAKKTLLQAQKAVAIARAAQGADGGQFVVGYTTVFDRSVIPDVSAQLQQKFPNWQIVACGKHSIKLVRDVKNGVLDVAFVGLFTNTQGLSTKTILEEPVVVAVPAKHRLARKRRIGFDDLRGEPMFWFERQLNPGFYDHCQDFFQRIGFKPNVIPEPADHHIMLGLIAEGKGVALIPASLQNVKRQGVTFKAMKEGPDSLTMGVAVTYGHLEKPSLRPLGTTTSRACGNPKAACS